MEKIVKGLVSFARISDEDFSPCNFNKIIDSVFDFTLYHFVDKNIEIEKKFSDDLLFIKGDKSKLKQVVLNITSNASDAMPKGGKIIVKT